MKKTETKLEGVYIIEPRVFGDNRGWFTETYSKEKFDQLELDYDFVQDNHSFSKDIGTLRGIHFQKAPYAQAKLVRVIKGAVFDIAVDLRKDSPTYKQWVGVELSADNKKQLLIPRGFGHGFLTLTNDVEFVYKVDNYYNKDCDRSIRYNDPEINVVWPLEDVTLSEKDKLAPLLCESDCDF